MKSGCWLLYFLSCSTVLLAADDVFQPKFAEEELGADGIIPCTFSSEKAKGDVTVVWRMHVSFTGPVIFNCTSGINCSKSLGRYSLHGNPKERNVSLLIKNVSFEDEAIYFCRVLQGEFKHENMIGTKLKIRVSQAIESIYIKTLPSGEQYVTCDVKGIPLPNVTWIMPENMTENVTVKTSLCKALSFIPVNSHEMNYTCQIDGNNGQQKSIFFSALSGESVETECQSSLIVFIITVAVLAGIILILIVVAASFKKKGSPTPLDFANLEVIINESIYANM